MISIFRGLQTSSLESVFDSLAHLLKQIRNAETTLLQARKLKGSQSFI